MSEPAPETLVRWLDTALPGVAGPATLAKFPGGQSNPTYALDIGADRYVLRRKPGGAMLASAHAVDREYRLIAALHPTGFPVPRPIALCDDDAVFGAMFYVMDRVDGRTFWDGTLPGIAPADRRALYDAMTATLARLHVIDPATVGLGDYGRPGNYFARQVDRWTRQYRASQTDDVAEIDLLIDWLGRTVPAQERTAIIHGDYRIDNILFAPDAPRVAAVIDWELSTLGDPLADFAYYAMNWVLPAEGNAALGGHGLDGTGIPTLDEVVDDYCRLTGRAGLPDLHWYFAFNLFRLAAIVQGIKKRVVEGNASSAQAAVMAERVLPLARAGWEQAQLAGARA